MSARPQLTELRHGTARDLAAVHDVMQEAFEPRFGEAWTQPQCMGMLSLPGVWLTLAYREDVLAGFALARTAGPEAELLLLATRPYCRGRGVGGTLLRSVIDEARLRGAEEVHLEVRAGNDAARLYMREGFVQVGARPGYYRGRDGELFDARTFLRRLA